MPRGILSGIAEAAVLTGALVRQLVAGFLQPSHQGLQKDLVEAGLNRILRLFHLRLVDPQDSNIVEGRDGGGSTASREITHLAETISRLERGEILAALLHHDIAGYEDTEGVVVQRVSHGHERSSDAFVPVGYSLESPAPSSWPAL